MKEPMLAVDHFRRRLLWTAPGGYRRALDIENPEQLYLQDNTGALAGYVSTVEIGDMPMEVQDRIAEVTAAASL